jgi:hypothetical protein
MFHELLGDPEPLSTSELEKPLVEIASGTSSFGPRPEWSIWYHYLLAALLPRSHDAYVGYLLEKLLTGFMAHFRFEGCRRWVQCQEIAWVEYQEISRTLP